MSDQPKPNKSADAAELVGRRCRAFDVIELHTAAAKFAGADGIIIKPTGEWTAKLAKHGWYVEFDAMNGACIDNELTAKGIAAAHNAALAAERSEKEQYRTMWFGLHEACRAESNHSIKLREQLAAAQAALKPFAEHLADTKSNRQELILKYKDFTNAADVLRGGTTALDAAIATATKPLVDALTDTKSDLNSGGYFTPIIG